MCIKKNSAIFIAEFFFTYVLRAAAETAAGLRLAHGHATHESLLLLAHFLYGVLLLMDRILHANLVSSLLIRLIAGLTLLIVLNFLLTLRNDELATVHAGGLIDAVWEAKIATLLILYNSALHQSMVAPAIAGVRTGMAHSY